MLNKKSAPDLKSTIDTINFIFERRNNCMLKLRFANKLGIIDLNTSRQDIVNRVRGQFKSNKKVNIFETQHSIIVKLKKTDGGTTGIYNTVILDIIFDDTDQWLLIDMSRSDLAELQSLEVDDKEIDVNSFSKDKGCTLEFHCPYVDRYKQEFNKECTWDDIKNCKTCHHRTAINYKLSLKNYDILAQYEPEQYWFTVYRESVKEDIFGKYWHVFDGEKYIERPTDTEDDSVDEYDIDISEFSEPDDDCDDTGDFDEAFDKDFEFDEDKYIERPTDTV